MIRRLAYGVMLAQGWVRAGIALASGAAGALAMPPFGVWPALALSLVAAVWLIDGAAGGAGRWPALRRAALDGWLWGLGYFVAGLWWIGAAFLVEADVFAWLLPFGVLGLPAVLAVFPAFGFALARLIWSPGAGRILALAFGLGLSEWLRGWAFTGFPWNTLGMAFGQQLWLMQAASAVGLYGLTILAVAALASPATLATGETNAGRFGPPAAAGALVVLLGAFGAWRVPAGPMANVDGVKLRIVQPNLQQDAKFRPDKGTEILAEYLTLSDRATSPDRAGLADVTHLVWPESAFPFLLHREPNALARISAALDGKTILVTGAARQGEALPGESGRRFYNSIQAVAPDGAIVATYDKVHLVPFGEYVPAFLDRALRAIGLRQFVHIPGGFTAGDRQGAFKVPGLPDAIGSVCYEAIFPEGTAPPPGSRPGLILNVTNDGWFGDTPGPYQHFAQARLRAVERGLPLVRAANTGISGVADPYGRIAGTIPSGRAGVLDTGLPRALTPTLFTENGHFAALGLYAICLAGAIHAGRKRRRQRA